MQRHNENVGYNFDENEKFSWNEQNFEQQRNQQILEHLHSLKELCSFGLYDDDPEDRMLLETMNNVLNTLENTFTHHFESKGGHIISPKSDEPWD